VETVNTVLEVTAEFAQNVTFNRERIAKSLPAGHLDATTLADYLVYKVLIDLFYVTSCNITVLEYAENVCQGVGHM
jgi:hypothetical protein